MEDIFNLPHVFIVFNYGGSGNFLAGVCQSILNKDYLPLTIDQKGSSHTTVTRKINGDDYLSFGTFLLEHKFFSSSTEREDYYVNKIKTCCQSIKTPQVVWSHDFTNIPLYKKYFPNCKILVITTFTEKEYFASIIMNVNKIFLNENAVVPTTLNIWDLIKKKYNNICRLELLTFLDEDITNKIIANIYNSDCKLLVEYALLTYFFKYYNFKSKEGCEKLFNRIIYPSNNYQIIGQELSSYIHDSCITLPYSYLLNNNLELLLSKLSNLFEKKFTIEEVDFLQSEFFRYRERQNPCVLQDPFLYYENLKYSVDKIKYSMTLD